MRREGKLNLYESLYPHWAIMAYMVANSVMQQVEQEHHENQGEDKENNLALKGKGDSGAFSAIFDYMQENNLKRK